MVNWFGKDDYGPIAKELLRRYFAHFSTIKIDEKYKEKSFVIADNYFDEERLSSEEKQKAKNGDFDLIYENRSIDRVNGNLNILAIFNTPSEVISYNTKSLCKLTKDIDKLF